MSASFRLVSFNCAGVKSKMPYIHTLCEQADLVLLQETWLMPHELHVLDNAHHDFNNYSISSVNSDQSILVGRPYGGLTILHRKHLTVVGNIINFDDNRLIGYKVTCNNLNYLFINVYLPYYCEDNIAEYTMYIGKLEAIVEEYNVNGIIIMGDKFRVVGDLIS